MKHHQAYTLKSILSVFIELHNAITAGNLVVFLEIAANQGTTSSDIAEKMDLSKKTIAKQIATLKGVNLKCKLGDYPLIVEKQDKNDKRYKKLYLSEQGLILCELINTLMDNNVKSVNNFNELKGKLNGYHSC